MTQFFCAHLCPSVAGLIKPFVYKGLLAGWTATVSKSVSHGADGNTIRQNWPELAETSPPLAFKNAVEQDWYLETEKASYENEIHLVPARRNVLHAGQRDRQTDQPTHQRRNRGQEPARSPQRGTAPASAELAPCPRLPDSQRPRLCGTHLAGCHGADAESRQGE